jgi:hypothetical protein
MSQRLTCHQSRAIRVTAKFRAWLERSLLSILPTGTFTIAEPEGAFTCPCPGANSLSVSADNSTVFQGAGSFSSLAVGTLVDVDAAIQADGSLRAMRVAAYDSIATNVMTGPLLLVSSAVPDFYLMGRKQQGQDYSVQGRSMGFYTLSNSTSLQTSGQFSNVAALPSSAVFDGSKWLRDRT